MGSRYLDIDAEQGGASIAFSPSVTPCDPTISGAMEVPKPKLQRAYDNREWMHSRGARLIRIMSEFMETGDRLKAKNVYATILFCGSSRIPSPELMSHKMLAGESVLSKELTDFYPKVVELSRLITAWAATDEAKKAVERNIQAMPFYSDHAFTKPDIEASGLLVCSGGGLGMMEAANRGAAMVNTGSSIGMGISIKDGIHVNEYIDPSLFFRYHYFFTRKFWMAYIALGIVAAPGGIGTLDELMEFLNLKHTGIEKSNQQISLGRLANKLPVVLFGTEFWKTAINFDYLKEQGLVSQEEYDNL